MTGCRSNHDFTFTYMDASHFAKLLIYDFETLKIAAIHPDFLEAFASIPDGIRWQSIPTQKRSLLGSVYTTDLACHGLTSFAIMS